MNGFGCMAQALAAAVKEIMIIGWWVVLDLPLERGKLEVDPPSSLKHLIVDAANRGVQVYVMIYQEAPVLVNNSVLVEEQLKNVSNVHFMRHPPPGDAVFFWSHHEKVVIVDREIAFIGGLDFAYNRWYAAYLCFE